jgi:DNA polymerase-3 subunit epsilon
MREIVLDTETTGISPYDGHKVIEIGCLELLNYQPTGQKFHCYLNPSREVPQEAFKIHGISTAFLKDKPLFKDVAGDFLSFIQDSRLIIHNAKFDLAFLNHELKSVQKKPIEDAKAFCTFRYARQKFPGEKASLNELCKKFKIDISERTLHGALLDSMLLAKLYAKLFQVEQKNLTLSSKSLEIVKTSEKEIFTRTLPNYKLTQDEIDAHKEFLKENLKKNLWSY